MTTDIKTQYDKDEDSLIEILDKMFEHYDINLEDVISIIKDRCEIDLNYCDNPSCLKQDCKEKH
tara:strand:+ start:341 stop:532 length:192 start_codon:yes stop_codon:yes gene_type:complete